MTERTLTHTSTAGAKAATPDVNIIGNGDFKCQAACRDHKIGMQDDIVRFLSVPETVDQTVQRVLARKATELAELFD